MGFVLPKISVITPSLNSGKFIESAILSIIDNDYKNVECLVIDGKSSDNTLDILKRYVKKIIWVSEKDKGSGDAINKGLAKATGDIISVLCADDTLEVGCLSKVAKHFMGNTSVQWIYGKCDVRNEDDVEIHKFITWYRTFWQKRYNYNILLTLDFIAQPAVFWRREVMKEMGLWENKLGIGGDYEYWLKLGAKYKPAFINETLAHYRWHSDCKSNNYFARDAKIALENSKYYSELSHHKFLLPLQYLNYFSVVGYYSLLKILQGGKRI